MLSDCLSSIDLKLYAAFRSRTKVCSCCLIGVSSIDLIGLSSIDLKLYAVVGWSTKGVFMLNDWLSVSLPLSGGRGLLCVKFAWPPSPFLSMCPLFYSNDTAFKWPICYPCAYQMPDSIQLITPCQWRIYNWSPLASDICQLFRRPPPFAPLTQSSCLVFLAMYNSSCIHPLIYKCI